MNVSKELLVVAKALKNDADYRNAWKSNIAMVYIDSEAQYKKKTGKKVLNREDRHIVANNAAECFINLLCS